MLADFEALDDARLSQEFAGRSAAVAAEASVGQRRLLADGLILDAWAAPLRLRAVAATHLRLRELLGSLAAYNTNGDALSVATATKQALGHPEKARLGSRGRLRPIWKRHRSSWPRQPVVRPS